MKKQIKKIWTAERKKQQSEIMKKYYEKKRLEKEKIEKEKLIQQKNEEQEIFNLPIQEQPRRLTHEQRKIRYNRQQKRNKPRKDETKIFHQYTKHHKELTYTQKDLLNLQEMDLLKLFNKSQKMKALINKKIYVDKNSIHDFNTSLENIKNKVKDFLDKTLKKYKKFKFIINFVALFELRIPNKPVERKTKYINMVNFSEESLKALQVQNINDINIYIQNFMTIGKYNFDTLKFIKSGWSFVNSKYIDIFIYKNNLVRGGSYIQSPQYIGQGCLNIKNSDNECFKWCVAYHYSNKDKHSDRITVLKKTMQTDIFKKISWENINYPLNIEDIHIFENNNKNISVNVWNDNLLKLYQTKNKTHNIINLMLLSNEGKNHYIYIKNINKAIKCERMKDKKLFCDKCNRFYLQKRNHICNSYKGETQINFKEEEIKFSSKNAYKLQIGSFILYYDFEAFLLDNDDEKLYNKHEINSYAYYVVCSFNEEYNTLKYYIGKDPVNHFLKAILKEKDRINNIIEKTRKLHEKPILTPKEEEQFKKEKYCYCCNEENINLCRDHCHLTGKYRGPLCSKCNKLMKEKKNTLTCVAHNSNYDGQFILREAYNFTENIRIISTSEEKFMKFDFMGLSFIDSFKHLNASLDTLVQNLVKDKNKNLTYDNIKHTNTYFKDEKYKKYIVRKGIYPYTYPQTFESFEILELPEIKYFDNDLTGEKATPEKYIYIQKTYKDLKCKNFGDFHEFYLKLDVLLLADVFENYRKLCIENYKLDSVHFVSLPSLSYDAFLLLMNQQNKKNFIYTMKDMETLNFYIKQKKGGICQVGSTRYTKANNKYMRNYNKNEKSIFISYIDANNLYGWAMIQKLPFQIIGKNNKISLEEILNTKDDNDIGYTVSVNLHYPKHLHDYFKDYVPACINREVEESEISPYQKEILKENSKSHFTKSNKLILDLKNKSNYVCDYRLLKRLKKYGVEITRLNEVYEYKQDYILKNYIDFNTEKRKEAKNDFEKDFFKLLNNSIYGKMLQNILNLSNVKLTSDDKKAQKLFTDPNFKRANYANGLYYIEQERENIDYDRAFYVGTTILDLSKVLMLDFHYRYMKKKYNDKAELIYTDTDSFVYKIETDDLYQEMYNDRKEYFDLSNSSRKEFYDDSNEKVVGFMKCETALRPIYEFIALKPKMYSFLCDEEVKTIKLNDENKFIETKKIIECTTHNKCKGIKKSTNLKHDDYINVFASGKQTIEEQRGFIYKKHHVYTQLINKICLSSYDDKIYRFNNNYGLPYGHYKLNLL